MSMNLGSFLGSSTPTLNRMPHQRIRESAKPPVASPMDTVSTGTLEEVGYETNLEDLQLFARYGWEETQKDEIFKRLSKITGGN